MILRRIGLAIAALITVVTVAPVASSAQLPPQPTMPSVTLRTVKLLNLTGTAEYERAGTKPIEYRISQFATFSDASWQTFKEGSTTQQTQGRTTWITGRVPLPPNPIATQQQGCGAGTIKWRTFLQFRIRLVSQQMINSAVVGDSTCVPQGD